MKSSLLLSDEDENWLSVCGSFVHCGLEFFSISVESPNRAFEILKVTPLERYVLFPDLNATLSDGLSRRCEKVGDMAELCVIA